ncbi:MAG TPA: RNA polymerase sigma factor [Burkholderiaceae bacterium]|nr:RNA polymerase sigma factor [Burkholderiaceae bacterium]
MRATALPQSTGATAAAGRADTAQLPAADEALMLAYARGDLASFEELYSRHERPLYRFLLRSVRVPSVADELLQEVFLSVIRSAPHYEARARFTTWLYRIARNRLVDHWRSSDAAAWQSVNDVDGHEVSLIDNLVADASGQPEHIALDRGRARDLARALEDLPAAQRETFLLHVEAGLSIEQISTVTGCPHESIKSRFRYACAKLRARMSHWSQP